MAQIALPRQHVTQTSQSAPVGSPLYERRRASNAGPIELIPNPDFTFPQRYPDDLSSVEISPKSIPRPMSLQVYPSGRRGSMPGLRQKSISALPDFSFNPAGPPKAPTAGLSPPHSPSTAPTTPSRPMGHRRGGSELIGGKAQHGGISLLSSSPTKDGDAPAPPPNANLRPGPPAGRRGHAHRRSGAISSHDLSAIMRPPQPSAPVPTRSGSAPVTPLDGDQFQFGHSISKSVSQPSLSDKASSSEDPSSSPRRPPSRARVGFADTVEYIRPLSTISSETETSTIRGHSTTGSLSSIVSNPTPTPPRMSRPALTTTVENEERPSTAGAILDMATHKNTHFGGDLFNRKRPSSAVSPTSPTKVTTPTSPRLPAKRRGFFRLETRRSDPTIPTLPASASDPALSTSLPSPLLTPMREDVATLGDSKKTSAATCKSSRKPRKVKSWANSIISRKGKHGRKSKRRAPTPPADTAADTDDSSGSEDWDFEANFDVDNTVTIVSPPEGVLPAAKLETDIASWKPRQLKRVDSDTMSPVIDLDAALGPFNTPNGSSPRVAQRGFGAHRRALHSAGGVLQAHRRTESAPELVPFDHRPSAMGTTSTMADVFEEEEPEDDCSSSKESAIPTKAKDSNEDEVEDPKIQLVETEDSQTGSSIKWNFTDGLGIKRGDKGQETSSPLPSLQVESAASGNGFRTSCDVSPVEVVEDYEEPRTSSLTHSSDSTVTPQLAADEAKETQAVMSLPLPLPHQSLMTPDTFTSSFSSPDFRSSQASFDTPRLGTSASSMTDYRALPSPHFGEPGPEFRNSDDDTPSLTSMSTMTSAMQSPFTAANPRRPSERSTSLCSVPSELEQRRRKRSSIASLSRLINGSSFGERSKLSIEQRPHSEYMEPTRETKKKHKRLSKLKFWKPNKEASQQN